jgi:hypothetical protein
MVVLSSKSFTNFTNFHEFEMNDLLYRQVQELLRASRNFAGPLVNFTVQIRWNRNDYFSENSCEFVKFV